MFTIFSHFMATRFEIGNRYGSSEASRAGDLLLLTTVYICFYKYRIYLYIYIFHRILPTHPILIVSFAC